MNINFVCRSSKARKNGLAPVELSIIINSERKVISLDRQINPAHWNPKSQSVRNNKEINTYLQAVKQKCYTVQTEMMKRGMDFTLSTFMDCYLNGVVMSRTLLSVYDEHNREYEKQVMQGINCIATLNKYINARDYLAKYIKDKYGKKDIELKAITPQFIEGHYLYLLQFMNNNSACKILKRLKRIIQICIDERYIDVNPFKIKMKEDKVEIVPLTPEEIKKIKDKTITNDRLSKIRDLFIFQTYTGLAYVDMASLSKDDIRDGLIIKNRKKTDVASVIPLLPQAKEILEKYDYILPVLSNQKYNAYLKELGDICGVEKNLHSHLARHTFATTLLNCGMSLSIIAKAMGHANTRITEQTYAQLRVDTVRSEFDKISNLV